jgi:hypothetical protein
MSATMFCEIDFEVADSQEFGRHALQWVIGGARALSGQMLTRVSQDASVPKGRLVGGVQGPPGAEWGFVSIERMGKNGLRRNGKVVEESAVAWAEKEAHKGIAGMALGLTLLGPSGYPETRVIRFEAHRLEGSDHWCRVSIEAPESRFQDGAAQRAWLGFLRDFCDEVDPSYGQISGEYSAPYVTALEAFTGPPWTLYREGIARSRTVLRGYDWLTVVAAELADRLGGANALRSGGAFAQVEQLRSGGVWLLATGDYTDYTDDRVEAVWRALAPVLLKGTPSRDRAEREESPVRLVFRDAAEVAGTA